MNFIDDMKGLVRAVFKTHGIDYFDPEVSLGRSNRLLKWLSSKPSRSNADTQHILLRQYINSSKKFLPRYPKSVFVSKKVTTSSAPQKNKNVVQIIKQNLENGVDVNPFLSKGLFVAYEEDQLLYSWKMYHFHLNDMKTTDPYFTDRSDWLLMAYIDDDSAYLLDIRQHLEKDDEGGNVVWTRQEMISILDDEFPEAIKMHKLNGVVGVERTLSDKELRQARKAGLNVLPSTESSVFAPFGGGLATDGSSIQVTMITDQMLEMLYSWEEFLNCNLDQVKADFERSGFNVENLKFKLDLDAQGFIVTETTSNAKIPKLSQTAYFNPSSQSPSNSIKES